jgi:Rrf2 family protein
MRLSEQVEWGLHCATVLGMLPADAALPASGLAEFHGVPAPYLAKALQALSRAGIVGSQPGRRGGYRLLLPAGEISVLDVVEAIEGRQSSFNCTEIRKRGPSRVPSRLYTPVCAIAATMYRADEAWRAELARTTIADLLLLLSDTIPAQAVAKGTAWFTDAVR